MASRCLPSPNVPEMRRSGPQKFNLLIGTQDTGRSSCRASCDAQSAHEDLKLPFLSSTATRLAAISSSNPNIPAAPPSSARQKRRIEA